MLGTPSEGNLIDINELKSGIMLASEDMDKNNKLNIKTDYKSYKDLIDFELKLHNEEQKANFLELDNLQFDGIDNSFPKQEYLEYLSTVIYSHITGTSVYSNSSIIVNDGRVKAMLVPAVSGENSNLNNTEIAIASSNSKGSKLTGKKRKNNTQSENASASNIGINNKMKGKKKTNKMASLSINKKRAENAKLSAKTPPIIESLSTPGKPTFFNNIDFHEIKDINNSNLNKQLNYHLLLNESAINNKSNVIIEDENINLSYMNNTLVKGLSPKVGNVKLPRSGEKSNQKTSHSIKLVYS